jgi:hypothetical protein
MNESANITELLKRDLNARADDYEASLVEVYQRHLSAFESFNESTSKFWNDAMEDGNWSDDELTNRLWQAINCQIGVIVLAMLYKLEVIKIIAADKISLNKELISKNYLGTCLNIFYLPEFLLVDQSINLVFTTFNDNLPLAKSVLEQVALAFYRVFRNHELN